MCAASNIPVDLLVRGDFGVTTDLAPSKERQSGIIVNGFPTDLIEGRDRVSGESPKLSDKESIGKVTYHLMTLKLVLPKLT